MCGEYLEDAISSIMELNKAQLKRMEMARVANIARDKIIANISKDYELLASYKDQILDFLHGLLDLCDSHLISNDKQGNLHIAFDIRGIKILAKFANGESNLMSDELMNIIDEINQ